MRGLTNIRWCATWTALWLAVGCVGVAQPPPAGGGAGGAAAGTGGYSTAGGGNGGETRDSGTGGLGATTGTGGAGGTGTGTGTGGMGAGGAGDRDAGADRGTSGAGAPDAAADVAGPSTPADAAPPAGSVPLFVAQGAAGRTTISCDDGLTWVANRSDDDSLRCYSNGGQPDCDHGATAARGITWGGGWFFASFGWGAGGPLRRSRDGVTWLTALTPNQQGTIAFGNGRVLGGDRYSDDLGETWRNTSGAATGVTRTVGFLPQAGGRFILIGDSGSFVGTGASWTKVDTGCGSTFTPGSGVAAGPAVSVVVNSEGRACRSSDGGATWTSASVGGAVLSHPVWDGTAFRVWGRGRMYRSTDGAAWTAAATTPSNLTIEAVAINPDTGILVAAREEWMQWYDRQVFYRSEDGLRWTALPGGSFVPSHRILDIQFGYGAPSSLCSAR